MRRDAREQEGAIAVIVAITLVATDVDSTTLAYSIVTGPSHGALSGSAES